MTRIITLIAMVAATPAFAAKGPFFSLANTDFIVLISFAIFIGVLLYFKVPGMLTGMLDK
ncbi:MAG: ATP F0F1 synthase subunit B, partial [Boseongicola sp.]|nr:ATP F0F1 synthase subunit B [Boseongicola sp.]